jgi:two-component system copper resistance phosphate regulon response regulator CusR/two-component system response regulator QseB
LLAFFLTRVTLNWYIVKKIFGWQYFLIGLITRGLNMHILVVEDEIKLAELIAKGLAECSYTTSLVSTCKEASNAISESTFDAIVLDLRLPDGDGLELLKNWRNSGFMEPVLILSARNSIEDKITGLNIGADDYLSKPFSLEELVARIRSLMRRQASEKKTILTYSGIELNLIAHSVTQNGNPVDLTNKEYSLLEMFMQNQGRALSRTVIAQKIWDSGYDIDTNLLDVYMSRLRAKLEIPNQVVFKTIRGIGYKLE